GRVQRPHADASPPPAGAARGIPATRAPRVRRVADDAPVEARAAVSLLVRPAVARLLLSVGVYGDGARRRIPGATGRMVGGACQTRAAAIGARGRADCCRGRPGVVALQTPRSGAVTGRGGSLFRTWARLSCHARASALSTLERALLRRHGAVS